MTTDGTFGTIAENATVRDGFTLIETPHGTRQVPDPNDPRWGHRVIRYFSSEAERGRLNERVEQSWGHVHADSVFVAGIGNHWKPGVWEHVTNMVNTANDHGLRVTLEEIMDRCQSPYDALGAMRNEATLKAMEGYEWLCMVDNDVYPHPETLVRLVSRGLNVIAPYVVEPSSGKPLHGPHRQRWSGIQQVKWNVLSMILFRTSVFRSTGTEFWNNAIGADEGYHYQKLWHYGHIAYVDTEVDLRVGGDPTYPLATLRLEKDEHDDFWNKRRESFLQMPDRRPIDPNNPRVTEIGEYLPYLDPQTPSAVNSDPSRNGMPDGSQSRRNGNSDPLSVERLAGLRELVSNVT